MNIKKLTAAALTSCLLLSSINLSSTYAASTYKVNNSLKVYSNAQAAKDKKSASGTYGAGTYYIYKTHNGMINISRKSGAPGGWINPSDNKVATKEQTPTPTKTTTKPVPTTSSQTKTVKIMTISGNKATLSASIRTFANAADAKANKNSRGTYAKGTYFVYKTFNGMVNISRTSGVPGAWVNPNQTVTVTVQTPTKPTTPTKPVQPAKPASLVTISGNKVKLNSAVPTYVNAADAKAGRNTRSTYAAGDYFLYKTYNGMINISKRSGLAGAWINPKLTAEQLVQNHAIKNMTPLGLMVNGVRTNVNVSFEPVTGASGYEIFESLNGGTFNKVGDIKTNSTSLSGKKAGQNYSYYVRAYVLVNGTRVYSKNSITKTTFTPINSVTTVKNIMQTGLSPMGSTMYIWGGGWNSADNASGPDTRKLGLSPRWREFANMQNANYNHWNYKYKIGNGLDCSGFIGFINYNVLETSNNRPGYVIHSSKTGPELSKRGLGTYTASTNHSSYKTGDIMYNSGHVYMVIGQESDGSVLIMHSSPKGVKLSGTPTKSGNYNSKAINVAKQYMQKYFPSYYAKDNKVSTDLAYLTKYSKFTYSTKIVSDPNGYRNMSGEQVLRDLFK